MFITLVIDFTPNMINTCMQYGLHIIYVVRHVDIHCEACDIDHFANSNSFSSLSCFPNIVISVCGLRSFDKHSQQLLWLGVNPATIQQTPYRRRRCLLPPPKRWRCFCLAAYQTIITHFDRNIIAYYNVNVAVPLRCVVAGSSVISIARSRLHRHRRRRRQHWRCHIAVLYRLYPSLCVHQHRDN